MFNNKLSGYFAKIEVKHKDGTSTIIEPFQNLITNAGLDFIGVSACISATNYCVASSNSDEPLETDTSILNQLGVVSGIGSDSHSNSGGVPSWYYEMERTYTFPKGGVVGNVTKLYIVNTTGVSKTVFSVALTKDGGGIPTPVPVGAEDQLFVTWRLRKNIDTTPVTGTISIDFDGTPTDVAYEIKPANLGTMSTSYYFHAAASAGGIVPYGAAFETQTLGAITSKPSGAEQTLSGALASYSNGDYSRDVTLTAESTASNFATGIGSIVFGTSSYASTLCGYQISFTPKLPKNADKSISQPFFVSWGRA